MNLHESQTTHNPTDGQENRTTIANKTSNHSDGWHVRRKHPGKFVALLHVFIRRWSPILHPLSFVVYVNLEMAAEAGHNVANGNTDGWVTRDELIDSVATDDKGLRRAMRELERYRLIEYDIPNPNDRRRAGKRLTIYLDQTVAPPEGAKRRPFEESGARKHDTNGSHDPGILPEGGAEISSNHPAKCQMVASGKMPDGPSGKMPDGHLLSIALDPELEPSSSSKSSNTGKAPATTTTAQAKIPDLTPLKAQIPWIVENQHLTSFVQQATDIQPDITVEELAGIFQCKLHIIKGKTIDNPLAYLLASVLRAIAGDGLSHYRTWFASPGAQAARNGRRWT